MAIKVKLLMLNPARCMTPNVPTKESGTATAGISVAEALRRKRKITITTSAIDTINSICTSLIEARMVLVRSVSNATSTDAGIAACNCGNIFLMRSTVSMTFAPGWRCTFKITAGVVLAHAAKRVFSAPSMTSATSLSRIGEPLR